MLKFKLKFKKELKPEDLIGKTYRFLNHKPGLAEKWTYIRINESEGGAFIYYNMVDSNGIVHPTKGILSAELICIKDGLYVEDKD